MRASVYLYFGAALATFGCGSKQISVDDHYAALPAIGSQLPTFTYSAVTGGTITEASLRGTPTVVALWSSKCHVSRQALGELANFHGSYQSRGAKVVILADDDNGGEEADAKVRADGVHDVVRRRSRGFIHEDRAVERFKLQHAPPVCRSVAPLAKKFTGLQKCKALAA